MKTVDSLLLIQDLEARVEGSISLAIITFQNLDSEILLTPSSNGGWSIAQCLDHLNSYGNFYLPHIKKSLENTKQKSNGCFKSSWLGGYFTNMMRSNSGKKYKALKKHTPKQTLNAASVIAEFIHQQELLLSYLETAKNVDLNSTKIPISISPFIKLKLGDIFQFIIAHNERHLEQAKKNL